MADVRGRLCEHALQQPEPDRHEQRRPAPGRLDALARHPRVPGSDADRGRRHDVREHLDRPPVRLRLQRQGRRGEVEVRTRAADRLRGHRLLRTRQPRRRLRQRQGVRHATGRQDGRARCEHRQGTVERHRRRLQGRPCDHVAAGRLQEPRGHRLRRRRVRRARRRAGLQPEHRGAGLEDLYHSRGRGARQRHLEGRRLEDRRWIDVVRRFVRPGPEPALLGHEQRRAVGRAYPQHRLEPVRSVHEPPHGLPARLRRRHRQARVGVSNDAGRCLGLRRRQRGRAGRSEPRWTDDAGAHEG